MQQRPSSALREFLSGEAGSAILLMAAAVLAMLMANIGGGHFYHDLIHAETGPALSPKLGPMTVHLWINDGLMAVFFFLVGLEIKRELVDGGLSTWERRRLPFIAAATGMVMPGLFYLLVTLSHAKLVNGWAIPAATDIAFALGVLALLGSRAPASLKLLLTAIAIVDDMGAVAIIAFVYSQGIDLVALGGAAVVIFAMATCNYRGVTQLSPYILGFLILWYFMLLSGVHATVAGVLAAMTVPVKRAPAAPDATDSPLHRLERAIHPWSAYLIVPLFGFANAGLTFDGDFLHLLTTPLAIGVATGLFMGKQIGIFGGIWAAYRLGIADRPAGASWLHVYGMALLCGIGFTMSLFIGALAFPDDPALVDEAKAGILLGSIMSASSGYFIIRYAHRLRA